MTKLSPIDTILVDIIRPVLGSRCETHDKEEFPTLKDVERCITCATYDQLEQSKRDLCYQVLQVIGKDEDMVSKYEDVTPDGGIMITVDEDDNNATGHQLAHLSQFVSDKATNDLRAEQRIRLNNIFSDGKGEWR